MTYSFRIRFNPSPIVTIQLEANELAVPITDQRISLVICAGQNNKLSSLIGEGYESAEEAREAGEQFQCALKVALAKVCVGADFGDRATKGMVTEAGLEWLKKKIKQQTLLNDVHGLMVYQTDPEPRFAKPEFQMAHIKRPQDFMNAFTKAINLKPIFTDRDLLAYRLFNDSFFQPTSESRFLLLIMAVEALIEPIDRPENAKKHRDELIKQTKSSDLLSEDKESMIGTLHNLDKESIGQGCKRLAEKLHNKPYGDKKASKLIKDCYDLRSDLVHGESTVQTFKEIKEVILLLQDFVSDLLTGKFFGYEEQ